MTEKDISDLLKERRQLLGLTVDALAEKTGIPKPHLLALESQQFRLLPQERLEEFLTRCAKALELERLDYLPEPPRTVAKRARHRRQEPRGKTPRSYLPIFYLTLVAVLILSGVAYVVHHHAEKLEAERAKYALRLSALRSSPSQAASTEEATPSSSAEEASPQPIVTTTGGGNQLAVTLSQPSATVVLVVSLDVTQAEKSWIGVTDSDLPAEGIELNASRLTHTVTLMPEAIATTLTLGVTKGIQVTVDGQPLDLSLLTTDGLSTITLTIQR